MVSANAQIHTSPQLKAELRHYQRTYDLSLNIRRNILATKTSAGKLMFHVYIWDRH